MEVEGTALVTGASRGIGRAVSLELAKRGFDVVATMREPEDGRDLADVTGRGGGSLRVAALDVTRPETMDLPTSLRVLVNNAGLERENLPLEVTPQDTWRDIFEVNVFGLVEVICRAIPLIREAGGGVICNVTSSSLFAPVPFYAPYRASKAAVSAISMSLRAELALQGIRVVEVMPGPIDTDMLRHSQQSRITLEHAPYRSIAERVNANKAYVETMICPVDVAAANIVDAILDDDGPMRYGIDPLSLQMIETWRNTDDESLMRGMLGGMGAEPG
jgi:NAD(P)-dependent dehydrogenase (short-subunit alcohol dehydrogenase family)